MNNSEYILDFVLPRGKIGLQGVEGPTGPINPLEPMAFIKFRDSVKATNLEISDNFIFSNNNINIFNIEPNYIILNEPGYYEFTISGVLTEQKKSNRAKVLLESKNEDNSEIDYIISIYLSDRKEELYFSYTRIRKYNVSRKVMINFNKTTDSNASVQDVNLIIKKLPFD